MNVSPASLNALFAKDPASGAATPQKSPLAALLEKKPPSSGAQPSGPGKESAPGLDVAEKLKALGEQFLAVMLITDPVERARAAKDLYKQYAQTAKEYADATADGRAAAEAASQAPAAGAVEAAADPDASEGQPPAEAAQAADPATGPVLAEPPVVYMPGKRSNFAADIYMEQIKTFASAAEQVYQSAVEEARHKHRDKAKTHGFDDEMKAAKDGLTEAAKAVEGSAATADGYDPAAMALSSPAPAAPVLSLTV